MVKTDFLFAMPSWLSGVARSLDLAALFDAYNVSASTDEADSRALRADWSVIGEMLRESMSVLISESTPPASAAK